MNIIRLFIVMLVIIFGVTGCIYEEEENLDQEIEEDLLEVILFVNPGMCSGDVEYKEFLCEFPVELSGDFVGEPTAEMLVDGLSDLTGLDFDVTITEDLYDMTIDWSVNSTLIEGLGEREQKEEFYVADDEALTWMMLDSLAKTLKYNLVMTEKVYYSMDGGKELTFGTDSPLNVFPVDVPYQECWFYEALYEENNGDVKEIEFITRDEAFDEIDKIYADPDFPNELYNSMQMIGEGYDVIEGEPAYIISVYFIDEETSVLNFSDQYGVTGKRKIYVKNFEDDSFSYLTK